jgi:monovalent cation/proton antiporter MnhG/PhaG subunit
VNAKTITESIFLGLLVLSCWVGVIGMLRMPEPMQALHFLGLPACFGSIMLTVAVFIETGSSNTSWKTLLLTVLLLAANAVVTHAVARAFRTRELGRWEPRPGDPVEFVPVPAKRSHSTQGGRA